MKQPRRVLVADDHVAIREGVARILGTRWHSKFAFAANHNELLQILKRGSCELLIMGLNMPHRNSFELIAELKRDYSALRILIYSIHPEKQVGLRVLRAGADGFLGKGSSAEQLVQAAERVVGGNRYISEHMADHLASALSRPTVLPAFELLSHREFQVLSLIGVGKSPTEIGQQLHLNVKTVSTYRSRLLEKLALNTTAELIRYAVDHKISPASL